MAGAKYRAGNCLHRLCLAAPCPCTAGHAVPAVLLVTQHPPWPAAHVLGTPALAHLPGNLVLMNPFPFDAVVTTDEEKKVWPLGEARCAPGAAPARAASWQPLLAGRDLLAALPDLAGLRWLAPHTCRPSCAACRFGTALPVPPSQPPSRIQLAPGVWHLAKHGGWSRTRQDGRCACSDASARERCLRQRIWHAAAECSHVTFAGPGRAAHKR